MKSVAADVPLEKFLEKLPDTFSLADREIVMRAYHVAEEGMVEPVTVAANIACIA